jgi:hypothetical protein
MKIQILKLNAIFRNEKYIIFFKEGSFHNDKNASYVDKNEYKSFCLNGEFYSYEKDFTKESWRRYTKLQAFL